MDLLVGLTACSAEKSNDGECKPIDYLVGDVEAVKEQVLAWAKGVADVEWGSTIPAQRFHTLPGFEVAAMSYTSDIPLLDRWGTPMLYGPGSINVAHTPDEFVDITELRDAVDAYRRMVRALLAS